MYYHVLVEMSNEHYHELDKENILEIENDIIIPYLSNIKFQFDGYFIQPNKVSRIVVKESKISSEVYKELENQGMHEDFPYIVESRDIIYKENVARDITKQVFKRVKDKIIEDETKQEETIIDKTKVFIVHGHDNEAKIKTARFVEKLGLTPIILHEQASQGKTIIEKIEEYSNVGFGVVLYTPCDVGKMKNSSDLLPRARQNVVFEHGYLIGKIGRHNVCALVKDLVEKPNDISGIVYVNMDEEDAWHLKLSKELRKSGYNIDLNKL
ncbi:nucleotide-binding protein [Flavobacterium sp. DGU11]|uniref:Nucleotide-binding protein n=1 Tax=Flavobacterium arundinis TaxID=3139143 RepID=A0ABU9HWB4_9FLAO